MPLERLTPEDTRILRLESAAIAGHTMKLLILEPAQPDRRPSLAELRDHVAGRLNRTPRLRQKVKRTPLRLSTPVWVDDAEFDIANHIRSAAEGPVSRAELLDIAAELMSLRLDPQQPLWSIDLVEQLEDGGVALIWRIHHCMADGVTAMRLASQLLWDEDRAPSQALRWAPNPEPGYLRLVGSGIAGRAAGAGRALAEAGRGVVSPDRWRSAARQTAALPAAAWRELRHSGLPSPFSRRVGASRSIAFAAAPLDELKRLVKAVDPSVTLNDVVLCAAAGGLRRWLEPRGAGMQGLRVKVPVSLHGHDGEGEAPGNHDSFMFVDLPVAEADPVRRLLAINAETADRKNHHDAETIDVLFRDLGHVAGLGRFAQRWAMSPREFTLNISNVPGPREAVSVLGARLRDLYFVAEVGQLHALRISVVSAEGSMNFGLCADTEAVEDLGEIAAGIEADVAELARRVSAPG